MFFSAKQYMEYVNSDHYRCYSENEEVEDAFNVRKTNGKISLSEARRVMKEVKSNVVLRNVDRYDILRKFLRPWDVVSSIRDFSAPVGDYGIGIEVEYGFRSLADSRLIAKKIFKWRNIAIDYEGGQHPIEATFPPVLASKVSNSQAVRYIKLLKANERRLHHRGRNVGTHVNVSVGGVDSFNHRRCWVMSDVLMNLDTADCLKYFGRESPYGYVYSQGHFLEHKMFNSTTDLKLFKRYIKTAIVLTDMIVGTADITRDSVLEALRTKVKA